MKQKRPEPEPTSSDGDDVATAMRLFAFGFGAVFGKSPDKLPVADRRLLTTLQRYYAFSHNGFVLTEALDLCTRRGSNPPMWVLIALNDGLQRASSDSVSLARALRLGRGDKAEYTQFREQQPIMAEVAKRVARTGKIAPACAHVALHHNLNGDTVEKQYRRFWKDFFEYVTAPKSAKSRTAL